MRLFLGDTEARQKVDNGLCFDFELAGQLVNSNLIGVGHAFRSGHLLLRILLFVVIGSFFRIDGQFVRIGGRFGCCFLRQFGGDFLVRCCV